jgi:diketogulonate reductase-like aldo/keto reductase
MSDKTLLEVGKKYSKTPAQVSLKWLVQKGCIVIPKASSEEHLRANMDISDLELSPKDMKKIDSMQIGKEISFGQLT